MVLECQSLGVLELLVATEEGGPFRAKTSRISQQVHHMLIDLVTKALDWVKCLKICFPVWLVWLPNQISIQEPSHTEGLHQVCTPHHLLLRLNPLSFLLQFNQSHVLWRALLLCFS